MTQKIKEKIRQSLKLFQQKCSWSICASLISVDLHWCWTESFLNRDELLRSTEISIVLFLHHFRKFNNNSRMLFMKHPVSTCFLCKRWWKITFKHSKKWRLKHVYLFNQGSFNTRLIDSGVINTFLLVKKSSHFLFVLSISNAMLLFKLLIVVYCVFNVWSNKNWLNFYVDLI